jgi:hypothetical protein
MRLNLNQYHPMIALSIDLDKINQARIFIGKTGRRRH